MTVYSRSGRTRIVDSTLIRPCPSARGTVNDIRPSLRSEQLGTKWVWQMYMELLARNIATAAGLTYAYRLGRAHDEFERARSRRVMP